MSRVLKQGQVDKQSFKWRVWKSRWFVLDSESLSYYRSEQAYKSNSSAVASYPLEAILRVDLASSSGDQQARFIVETKSRVLRLQVESLQIAKDWIEILQSCCGNYTMSVSGNITPLFSGMSLAYMSSDDLESSMSGRNIIPSNSKTGFKTWTSSAKSSSAVSSPKASNAMRIELKFDNSEMKSPAMYDSYGNTMFDVSAAGNKFPSDDQINLPILPELLQISPETSKDKLAEDFKNISLDNFFKTLVGCGPHCALMRESEVLEFQECALLYHKCFLENSENLLIKLTELFTDPPVSAGLSAMIFESMRKFGSSDLDIAVLIVRLNIVDFI